MLSLSDPLGTLNARRLDSANPRAEEVRAWAFAPSSPVAGRTGRLLIVDIGAPAAVEERVPDAVVDALVGGRGLALWMLWRAVSATTSWDAPENALVVSPGPLCGATQFTGAGKASVVSLSPLTGAAYDSSVGGYFGPLLKSCGFDALAVVGRSGTDVRVLIDGERGRVALVASGSVARDCYAEATRLTDLMTSGSDRRHLASVLLPGLAADHSPLACLHVSRFDYRRDGVRLKQAGRGGLGRVLRAKGVTAVAIVGRDTGADLNGADDPPTVAALGRGAALEIRQQDDHQNRVRRLGTTHLVDVMNAYGILPVRNFQAGRDPAASALSSAGWEQRFRQHGADGCCQGCQLGCSKAVDCHRVMTGPHAGRTVLVDGPEYSSCAALGSNCGIFDPEWVLEGSYYCDAYGVDTISFGVSCAFAMECRERGILDLSRTGGVDLRWGNAAAQLTLLHQLACGDGFGAIVGRGVRGMQDLFTSRGWGDVQLLRDIGMQLKGLEYSPYVAQESAAQQAGYALASKGPQHDEAWLIFLDMVNRELPDDESMAEALHYYPMFRTWFGLAGLCRLPWNEIMPADNERHGRDAVKVPEHVDAYCRLFTAVTGAPLTPEGLLAQSERVYTFQRLFNLRMGAGTRTSDAPPHRAIGPVTRDEYERHASRYDAELASQHLVGNTIDERLALHRSLRRQRLERIAQAAYRRRGWSSDGVPTSATIARLGLEETGYLLRSVEI